MSLNDLRLRGDDDVVAFDDDADIVGSSDGNDKRRPKRIASWKSNWLFYLALFGVILFLINTIAVIAAVLIDGDFTLRVQTLNARRHLPSAAGTALVVTQTSAGLIDIGLIAALTSFAGFVAFLVSAFTNDAQISQIENGANPYIWLNMAIWHVPAWLLYAAVVQPTLAVLILVPAVALAWIFCWYASDYMNADAIRDTYARALAQYGARGYSWIPIVISVGFFIVVAVVQIIGISLALSDVTLSFSSTTTFGVPFSLALIPIVGLALYLLVPLVVVLGFSGLLIGEIFWRDFILYIVIIIYLLVTTWLPLIVFVTDSLSPDPFQVK